MIKMSLFITRRSDLTREQFNDYWLNKHWPIVRTVSKVKTHTRRYVQLHNLGQTPQGYAALPFDGVAEAWFDSLDDFYKVVTSKGWHDIVQKDDLNYLDPSKTQVLVSEEKVNFKA